MFRNGHWIIEILITKWFTLSTMLIDYSSLELNTTWEKFCMWREKGNAEIVASKCLFFFPPLLNNSKTVWRQRQRWWWCGGDFGKQSEYYEKNEVMHKKKKKKIHDQKFISRAHYHLALKIRTLFLYNYKSRLFSHSKYGLHTLYLRFAPMLFVSAEIERYSYIYSLF